MCTIDIEALTPLSRNSCIKLYKNNARSRLFRRIAKRSIVGKSLREPWQARTHLLTMYEHCLPPFVAPLQYPKSFAIPITINFFGLSIVIATSPILSFCKRQRNNTTMLQFHIRMCSIGLKFSRILKSWV